MWVPQVSPERPVKPQIYAVAVRVLLPGTTSSRRGIGACCSASSLTVTESPTTRRRLISDGLSPHFESPRRIVEVIASLSIGTSSKSSAQCAAVSASMGVGCPVQLNRMGPDQTGSCTNRAQMTRLGMMRSENFNYGTACAILAW